MARERRRRAEPAAVGDLVKVMTEIKAPSEKVLRRSQPAQGDEPAESPPATHTWLQAGRWAVMIDVWLLALGLLLLPVLIVAALRLADSPLLPSNAVAAYLTVAIFVSLPLALPTLWLYRRFWRRSRYRATPGELNVGLGNPTVRNRS